MLQVKHLPTSRGCDGGGSVRPTEAERATNRSLPRLSTQMGIPAGALPLQFSPPDNSRRQAASAAARNSLEKKQIVVHFGQDTQTLCTTQSQPGAELSSSPCLQDFVQEEPVAPCAPLRGTSLGSSSCELHGIARICQISSAHRG